MHSPPPPYSFLPSRESSVKRKLTNASLCTQTSIKKRTIIRDIWWFVCPNTYGIPFKKAARYHCCMLVVIGVSFLYVSSSVPKALHEWNPKDIDEQLVKQILVGVGAAPLPCAMGGFFALHARIPGLLVMPAVFYSFIILLGIPAFVLFLCVIGAAAVDASLEMVAFGVLQICIVSLILSYVANGYRVMVRVKNDMMDDFYDLNPHLIPAYRDRYDDNDSISEPESEYLKEPIEDFY